MNTMTTIPNKVACHTCSQRFRHLCRAICTEENSQGLQIQRRFRAFPAETRLQEENEQARFTGILRKRLAEALKSRIHIVTAGDVPGARPHHRDDADVIEAEVEVMDDPPAKP